MNNEELFLYMKDLKSEIKQSIIDLGTSIISLSEKFDEHAKSGANYRFQVDRNTKHIDGIKHRLDGMIPTVMKFIDKVEFHNEKIDKIKEMIDKRESKSMVIDAMLDHPKILIIIGTVVVLGIIIAEKLHSLI